MNLFTSAFAVHSQPPEVAETTSSLTRDWFGSYLSVNHNEDQEQHPYFTSIFELIGLLHIFIRMLDEKLEEYANEGDFEV